VSAKDRLKAILQKRVIEAASIFGQAKDSLTKKGLDPYSQKCVCFTETPLEYIHLLCEEIEGRNVQFEPYGIALTKKLARRMGVNPVWYVDISPGQHNWLTKPLNELIDTAIEAGTYEGSPVSRIAPFIEQMGTGRNEAGSLKYRKEFWWEREWRHPGRFLLPDHLILLCPENEHEEFEGHSTAAQQSVRIVDPMWGLEQIIARLAGFAKDDIEVL
jgi:hypothetical protein